MKTLNLIAALMLISAVSAMAQLPLGGLPQDSLMRVGKLDNGLTYYIRHNEYPKNQCCFYIAQKVGSMQEEENQRGLAHLLEHMAFNGTEHFPGGRLIKFLEENGIKFGAELNAYTSLEQTVYNIDAVPTNKGEALLDSCLQILADWSGGVSLLDEEIDKERGVVKSEYLMRNSAQMRMYDSILPAVMSNTKYAYRMPIGLMDVVENCPYNDLRAYYKKWYHPSYQGVVIVGDIDVDKMEQKVRKLFAKYNNPENYAPLQKCEVPFNEEPIFATARDKEQRFTNINLYFKFPKADNERLPAEAILANSIVNKIIYYMAYFRISEVAKDPNSPLLSAAAGISDYVLASTMNSFVMVGQAKPQRELEAYKLLLREALRIGRYGFSIDEFERCKAEILSQIESLYRERDKQENSYYVQKSVNSFLEYEPLVSIEDEYNFSQQVLSQLNLDDINRLINSIINDKCQNMAAFNFSPEADGQFYFSESIYKTATQEVLQESIEARQEDKITEPLLKKQPKAGKIVSQVVDPLTGAKILKLSNGAVVYVKKTDFKDDEILFAAHSFGGQSLYEVGEQRNLKYLSTFMDNVGLGSFSSTQLNKYLAGRQLNLSPFVNLIDEGFSGATVPKDLDVFMELLYCSFCNPGNNTADFENLRQRLYQSIATAKLDPRSALTDSIDAIRYNHNPRNMELEPSEVEKIDFKRIQAIYRERFANAADFVFFFVGNFDEAVLNNLICKYIASLPAKGKRENFRPHTMDFNTKYVFCCTEREMATPESRVQKYYTLQDVDYNLSNMVTYQILAQILDKRFLKCIREDAGIAYHSGCRMYFYPSETKGKADLTFVASNPLKPEYANRANQMMDSIITAAVDKGFSQDELNDVRAFMIKNHTENQRVNNYWLTMMQRKFIYDGDFLSGFSNIVENLTVEQLQQKLKSFVERSFVHTYILLPEGVEQVE